MDLDEQVADGLRRWAAHHDAVREIWLFGSRAKRSARTDSDVDIALLLMPAKGSHDWAFGDYVALHESWKSELSELVGGPIDLVSFRDDLPGPFDPRVDGICLWSRYSGATQG